MELRPVYRDEASFLRQATDSLSGERRDAVTNYKVLSSANGTALVECQPETGLSVCDEKRGAIFYVGLWQAIIIVSLFLLFYCCCCFYSIIIVVVIILFLLLLSLFYCCHYSIAIII